MTKTNKWDDSVSYYNYKPKPKSDPKIERIKNLILHADIAEATFPYLAEQIYHHNNQSDICDLVLNDDEDSKLEIEMFYTYHENIAQQIESDDQILNQLLQPLGIQNKEAIKNLYTNLLKYQDFDEFYSDLKAKIKKLLTIEPPTIQEVTKFIIANAKDKDNQFTYFLAAEFVHEDTTNSVRIETMLDTYDSDETITFPCGHTFSKDEDLDECPFCNDDDED
jgi:hypothetical protein